MQNLSKTEKAIIDIIGIIDKLHNNDNKYQTFPKQDNIAIIKCPIAINHGEYLTIILQIFNLLLDITSILSSFYLTYIYSIRMKSYITIFISFSFIY